MKGRYRIYRVETQALIGLFNLNTDRIDQICVPIIKSIPIDAVVVRAYFDWSCDSICFIVSHESFDYVEEFANIPWQKSELLGTVFLQKDKGEWREQQR